MEEGEKSRVTEKFRVSLERNILACGGRGRAALLNQGLKVKVGFGYFSRGNVFHRNE